MQEVTYCNHKNNPLYLYRVLKTEEQLRNNYLKCILLKPYYIFYALTKTDINKKHLVTVSLEEYNNLLRNYFINQAVTFKLQCDSWGYYRNTSCRESLASYIAEFSREILSTIEQNKNWVRIEVDSLINSKTLPIYLFLLVQMPYFILTGQKLYSHIKITKAGFRLKDIDINFLDYQWLKSYTIMSWLFSSIRMAINLSRQNDFILSTFLYDLYSTYIIVHSLPDKKICISLYEDIIKKFCPYINEYNFNGCQMRYRVPFQTNSEDAIMSFILNYFSEHNLQETPLTEDNIVTEFYERSCGFERICFKEIC